MPEITRIEKTFTYDVPDAYLYQTNALKKKSTWTYAGPDKLWIFVDNATGKVASRFHYTDRDNGSEVTAPDGMTKVLVDANTDPLLASMVHNEVDYGSLEHTVEELPDGSTYGHPVTIPPDHAYELTDIQYDAASNSLVKPYPWKQPHMTWENITVARTAMLLASDTKYALATAEQKPVWEAYRQLLRDLPTTFAGVDPWKIPFPAEPFAVVQPTLE